MNSFKSIDPYVDPPENDIEVPAELGPNIAKTKTEFSNVLYLHSYFGPLPITPRLENCCRCGIECRIIDPGFSPEGQHHCKECLQGKYFSD